MDFAKDFASAQDEISQALISTTRAVSQLCAEDIPFHRSLDRTIGPSLDEQSSRLLSFAQKLLRRSGAIHASERFELSDVESIDNNWRTFVDAVDGLLERTDTCLDEFNGLVKQATPRDNDAASPAPPSRTPRKQHSSQAANLPKPQLLFDTKTANTEVGPFKPFLTTKPHATVPLDKSLALRPNENGIPQYLHPYATEISSYEYPPFLYTQSEPIQYIPFEGTTATLVEDMDGVYSMLEELKKAPIIAIDLEHHDTHSYVGIVSLMQISTRDNDWIVDTLKPWRRKLEVLNDVFADPAIVKVLHGAFMDITWLQRDLGLYVVGLFDTHHASRALGYPAGSLAYLLKRFVDFDAQKQYQTADWRMRPLPTEMFDYARSDTHFLLYVFDNMRNELVEKSDFDNYDKDKVQAVLVRSKEVALQRYEYFVYDAERGLGQYGWFNQLQRASISLSKEQFAVYRKVHQWRDTVARQEDESPTQMLSKQALFKLIQVLPRDLPTLLGVSHPISQYLRVRSAELLEVINSAIADAANGPEMHELMTKIATDAGLFIPRRQQPAPAPAPAVAAAPAQPVNGTSKQEDVRLSTSSLWGATLSLQSHKSSPTTALLPILAPTFSMTPSVLRDVGEASPSSTKDILPTPTNDISTPSSTLGKRKLDSILTEDATDISSRNGTSTPLSTGTSDAETEAPTEKAMRKMQRKAEKRAAKSARKEHNAPTPPSNSQASANGAAAFDYGNARSVLHADDDGPGRKKGKQAPVFDPYKKAMDAPSGVKAAYAPKAGRSQTFKR